MPKSKLTLLRESKGLSQQQLASLIYVEQSTLSKYENNQRNMTEDTLLRLAHALDATPEDIVEKETANTYFESGSIANGNGIGHVQNYYQVPKDLLDSIVLQQNTLTDILKILVEKLG